MNDTILTPEEIVKTLTNALGSSVLESRVQIRTEGKEKRESKNIWIVIDKAAIHKAVEELMKLWYPHLSCISGYDKGSDSPDLRIQYIFSIYGGVKNAETMVIFSFDLPKENAILPTITDLLEGAAFTEQEKIEYLGIRIDGLKPAEHKFFLPQDFPEDIYPLRKDEHKIPDSMVKNLYACGRPVGRKPAPLTREDE